MDELIKIRTSNGGKQVVSARELHEWLHTDDHFSQWAKRMFEYGFSEGVDFKAVHEFVKAHNGIGGTNKSDFALTIDCAKEIAMLQRTEKGKQARLYFIECERRLQPIHSIPQSFSDALLLAANQAKQIEEKQQQINALIPKASFYDSVKDCQEGITMEETAKVLNNKKIGRNNLFKFLREKNILTNESLPYQKYLNAGYFRIVENVFIDKNGKDRVNTKILVHQKGIAYINHLLNK